MASENPYEQFMDRENFGKKLASMDLKERFAQLRAHGSTSSPGCQVVFSLRDIIEANPQGWFGDAGLRVEFQEAARSAQFGKTEILEQMAEFDRVAANARERQVRVLVEKIMEDQDLSFGPDDDKIIREVLGAMAAQAGSRPAVKNKTSAAPSPAPAPGVYC